ncbi:MAG: helix-turn-helix domain-containing protein [Firmicutes bacterium]|nr:helix-turn-helix domain-containing protein [Bacillota bacterium]
MNSSRLMTAQETAKLLGVSKHRLYEMAKKGLVPSCRLGRQVKFDLKQIEEWLAKGGTALPGGWRWQHASPKGGATYGGTTDGSE